MRKTRPILRLLIPAVLITFALALYVVGARSQATGSTTVTVTITPGNPPTVSPATPVDISQHHGDQVKWECPQCTSGFAVHFPTASPFASKDFGPKNAASGAARANAAVGLYHYSVTVNGHTLEPGDPGVRLTP